MRLATLLPAALLALSAAASPALERRATSTCNRDNLLRCFVATPGPASAYCTSFVGASTVTVATVTPTTTVTSDVFSTETDGATTSTTAFTSTSTTTLTTQSFTATATASTTVTVYVTVTATSSTTVVVATATITPAMKAKRDAYVSHLPRAADEKRSISHLLDARQAPVQGPACLTTVGSAPTSYSPARITSACSCIGISQTTVSVTATATPATSLTTLTIAATTTTTSTATVTSTITVSSTNTISSTSTTTVSVTATSTGTTSTQVTQTISGTTTTTAPTPPCNTKDVAAQPYNGAYKYHQAYAGVGYRETDQNQANSDPTGHPPLRQNYAASITICQALQNCINFAITSPNGYFDVALYQLVSDGSYQCVAYFDGSGYTDPKYFTIPDANVARAFGYTLQ